MKPALTLLALFLLTILPAAAEHECEWTPWVSEENAPLACPRGFAIAGMRCSGDWCDRKSLLCCPYGDRYDPATRTSWSPWFSEEHGGGFGSRSGFAAGIDCRGKYCDDVRLEIVDSPSLARTGECASLPWFSEEGRGESLCPEEHFVAGLACRGRYCDELSLECCRAHVYREPTCDWFAIVSDETPPAFCPGGQALKGLRCTGQYCDDKELFCCPYMDTEDRDGHRFWSPWFSEEGYGSFIDRGGFVAGIQCRGNWCDEMRLDLVSTPNLTNLGECYSEGAISEEGRGEAECRPGFLVAGITCRGRYCDEVVLECCRGQSRY